MPTGTSSKYVAHSSFAPRSQLVFDLFPRPLVLGLPPALNPIS